MFPLNRFRYACLAAAFVALPAAAQIGPAASYAPPHFSSDAGTDSVEVQTFELRSRSLADALAEYSRQSGVTLVVEVERLPDVAVTPISGKFTRVEALRLLLSGTGLTVRFADLRTAVITGHSIAAGTTRAHALRSVVVRGAASRARGYGVTRSTSATRTDAHLLDTPQSVTVVSSELISDQAMQSVSDVVRYAPGVTMGSGEGHRDQPTIRGNNSTADFFVDGMRDDAQFFRDLYNVDRVEVLKGPNAMVFGRGGGGGVINRVLKEAHWAPTRDARLELGTDSHRRATFDLGHGAGSLAALRLNAMAERSGGFRDAADIRRQGVNPTAAFALGARTTLRAGVEHLLDERTVDRGIPSLAAAPAPVPITAFFGDPAVNRSRASNNLVALTLEHATAGHVVVRSRMQLADYDKSYRNTVPGAVKEAGSEVSITAYSDAMRRRNAISQTDVLFTAATGPLHHSIVLGGEASRQRTNRLRLTGFFNDAATSVTTPLDQPTIAVPVTFRPNATDPDTRSVATVAAAYAQDQIALGSHLQFLLGLRHDRFSVLSFNHRTGEELRRRDNLVSPRAAVVLKPAGTFSVYGSHSVSYLPSAGDQFTHLTLSARELEPERFTNREVGIKWEPSAALSLSAAAYRLDRTNTVAPDPTDPARVVQTGAQRSSGFELGAGGNVTPFWQLMGGYASQRARVVSATTAAPAGALVPLVPNRTLSLWNRFDFSDAFGAGAGIVHQSDVFAGIDNRVRLPAFTRIDAAVYLNVSRLIRLQANVENVLDERYYPTAHNNNNIMPGAPRTLRVSLIM